MNSALNISSYFLSKYGNRENDITPMKLIKLVYIAHGWYLALADKTLIDENPEAWKYGPVIPSIYHEFKEFRNQPITSLYEQGHKLTDSKTMVFLDKIWEVYGKYTAIQLSDKTHQPDSPWSIVWNDLKNKNRISLQIPENLIQAYYKGLVTRNQEAKKAKA